MVSAHPAAAEQVDQRQQHDRTDQRQQQAAEAEVAAVDVAAADARFRLFDAVADTLQAVTKLKGGVRLVAPGSLPNDGKVIADERPVG